MFRKTSIILALAIALLAVPASAASINFLDSSWNPGASHTFTRDLGYLGAGWAGTTLTVTSIPTNLYWDNNDGNGYADGFGVTGGENDEVDRREVLAFTFNKPVFLQSVGITDLFYESTSHPYIEKGFYSIDGGANQLFQAAAGQLINVTNGITSLDLGNTSGQAVVFTAYNVSGENHDYSVSGINATLTQTPEPGTLILLGSALFGGAFLRRRRRS